MKPITTENKIITLIVALALFMDSLDASIINTAVPAMSQSLKVNPVDLKIALISYLLSLAIFIPISGWLGDKLGVKRIFIAALGIFTLSSFWCGYSHTLMDLVIARSIQGLGGSLMIPLGRLIILRTYKRHEVVEAMNIVIMVVSVGLMLGPFAGGIITDHLSWPWIFWVNIPAGLLAIIAGLYWLPDYPKRKVKTFDLLGFVLFSGGIALLTFALSDLSVSTSSEQTALLIMCIAVFMLASYFLHSTKQHHPIINIELFRIRTFQVSVIGSLLGRIAFGGVPFLLPLLLQVGLGYSAQLSGTLLVPIAFGILLIKFKSLSLRVLRLFGYKRVLLFNTFLVACSLWSFLFVNASLPIYYIALLTFIFGFLISMQYSAMNSMAYAEITVDDLSSATSIVSMMQQLSQSFGVATGALLLRYFSSDSTQQFLLTPITFHKTFLAMGFITFICALMFMKLKPTDGHQLLAPPTEEKTASTH